MTNAPSLHVSRGGLPTPPVEIADEVELYAREWGRHATLHFVPTLFANGRILRGTWVIKMTLRPDDKRMKSWQEGKLSEVPTEDVWLAEPNPEQGKPIRGGNGLREPPIRPLDIVQMGAGGVRAFLEKGNMWSGRNKISSPEQEMKRGLDDHAEQIEKAKSAARDEASRTAADKLDHFFNARSVVKEDVR